MGTKPFERAEPSCGVCGSRELELDHVHDAGRWMLAACRRCDHRWTAHEPRAAREPRLVIVGPTAREDLVAA